MNNDLQHKEDEQTEPLNFIWIKLIGDAKNFKTLGIIELFIVIGIAIFAVVNWDDDSISSYILSLCVKFGYINISAVAVFFLMKLFYRKRLTIKANIITFVEILTCIFFISLVVYSFIHWDYEGIKKSILYFCAAVGIIDMLRHPVRLTKLSLKKEKPESFKVMFAEDITFCILFTLAVILGITSWDDEDMRYEFLSCCAFLGITNLGFNMAASILMLSRKRNNRIGNDFFRQSETEIKAMKEEMEALTGKLEETNKKKDELERQLEETNKNKDELCRQLKETNKNRDELEQQLKETNKDKNELERQLEETNKNKDEIEQQLEETSKNKSELERQLIEQKEELSTAVEINRKKGIRRDTQRREMLSTKAYSVAKARIEECKPISEKDWKAMEEELDELFGEFKSALYEAHSLTDLEYRICWLVKMGFKNIEVSILISRAPNAVSLSRKRLYTKITGKEGTASDFDTLIKEL